MAVPWIDPLVVLTARAFDDGTLARWLQPDDAERRRRQLGLLFLALFEEVFVARRTIDVRGDPALAVAVWSPPGTWRYTAEEELALGPRLAEALGDDAARLGPLFAEAEQRHPTAPHWYLDVLAVDPDAQGDGVGTRFLADGLRRCDEQGDAAYLWTATLRNVEFYGRHGFHLAWSTPALGGDGPPAWGLWREPGA